MNEPHQYGFDERLRASQAESSNGNIRTILMRNIPSALDVSMAHAENDRSGVDWWVECVGARFLAVDCKVRDKDWACRKPPKDDIALETWSVVEKNIPGWTRDKTKRADFILWLWKDSGRWMLVPFQMLCHVFSRRWLAWSEQYQTNQQFTRRGYDSCGKPIGYHSECVFVPRLILWRELYKQYGG